MERTFAPHRITKTVTSDNGPQYSSKEYSNFAIFYGFSHITSSTGHPPGNGEAEHAVRTVTKLLKDAKDPYLALLSYRSSPMRNSYSPADRLMRRKLRTIIAMVRAILLPKTPNTGAIYPFKPESRQKLKVNFDKRCGQAVARASERGRSISS